MKQASTFQLRSDLVPVVGVKTRNPIPDDRIIANVSAALALGLPTLERAEAAKPGLFTIVGAGPSLKRYFDIVKSRPLIVAAGSGHEAMQNAGIVPHVCVVLDPMPIMADFIKRPHQDTHFYVASHCDPAVFDLLRDNRVTLWHAAIGIDFPAAAMGFRIGGGSTVTLRSWNIGMVLGYRSFEYFGFDCCLMDGERHMLPDWNSLEAYDEEAIPVVAHGREFVSTTNLLAMAYDYIEMAKLYGHLFTVAVHGGGLASWITHRGQNECRSE